MSYPPHIFEKLEAGEDASWRPKGNSMTPKIKSGQLCTVSPVEDPGTLRKGDIVLCKVRGNTYLHLISAIRDDGAFQISNNHGHVNGWTRKIFGKLVRVEP